MKRQVSFEETNEAYRFALVGDDGTVFEIAKNTLAFSSNVFQRIFDGSILFKDLTGKGYRQFIGDDGVDMMNTLINRRHLISHNNGIVDDTYLRKTSDTAYAVGQRIVINDRDLLLLLGCIEKIVDGLLGVSADATTT